MSANEKSASVTSNPRPVRDEVEEAADAVRELILDELREQAGDVPEEGIDEWPDATYVAIARAALDAARAAQPTEPEAEAIVRDLADESSVVVNHTGRYECAICHVESAEAIPANQHDVSCPAMRAREYVAAHPIAREEGER